ncbi:MAG: ThiJ/PfpI domain protein [Anaerocolumna sp.]|jgi:putative intracellular protease/amidase|nr:ThiJ/PfpI domain protein [Anaerocolumna sp.]
MADFEITLLLHRLKNQGAKEIVSIASRIEILTAQSGLSYKPDKLISEITDLTNVEALIIPGGPINNQQNDICQLVKDMVKAEKLVGAICFAPQFLGRAGILENYNFTTSCSEDTIKHLKVEDPFYWPSYKEARVVKDRNIITAKGHAFIDFSMAVCGYLNIYESEEQLQEYFKPLKHNE